MEDPEPTSKKQKKDVSEFMHPLNIYRFRKPSFPSLAKKYPSFAPFVHSGNIDFGVFDLR